VVNQLFGPELKLRINRYLMTKGTPIELSSGDTIEGMSLKDLMHYIATQCTAEEKRAVHDLYFGHLAGSTNDDREAERRANIEQSNQAFNFYVGENLPANVPEGSKSLVEFKDRRNKSVKAAREAVDAWLDKTGKPILTLSGSFGTGKSHLVVAAGRVLVERNETIAYRRESDLISDLKSHIKTNDVEGILREYCTVPWLIIDDFGQETETAWTGPIMDRLFNARWEAAEGNVTRTLVTSNLLSEDLPGRIASRLGDKERGVTILIDATDYRRENR
jgi:DNA replication protein DnaC